MSKFDQSRMVEECAEYKEYLEAPEAGLKAQMAEYFYDQANLELQGLHNG